jgi:hypothetical protein
MTRPNSAELLLKFFPEVREGSLSDREAAVRLSTLACEVVLADQIDLFSKGLAAHGLGCLVVRLFNGARKSAYQTLEDIKTDACDAQRCGDRAAADFFTGLENQIKDLDPDRCALVVLVDNSRSQLLLLDREYPAKAIQALLQEAAA